MPTVRPAWSWHPLPPRSAGLPGQTLRSCQVLILAAYRSDELAEDQPLRPFLADLGRLPSVRRVQLGWFNRTETAARISGLSFHGGLAGATFRCRRSRGDRPDRRLRPGSDRFLATVSGGAEGLSVKEAPAMQAGGL